MNNRVIKFRAWIPSYNEMRYMPEPADQYKQKISYNIARFFNLLDGEDVGHYIMQFTGLTDKHGNEIYEGDIVEYHYRRDTQTWEKFTEIVEWEQMKDYCGFGVHLDMAHYEVIGNIYENANHETVSP